MRGDQLSRQWRVLRQIEASRYGLTAAEIAEFGGVSRKTGYRDLYDLQLAGFPLYAEEGESGRRWKFIDTYQLGIPQPFTFTELVSLHLSQDLFKVFRGTVFYESMQSLFEKVRATLPPQTQTYLDRVQSAFHMGIKPYKDYGRFREMINQVNQAVVECRSVEIAYRSLGSGSETLRKLDPYKIWFYDGTIYVIGHCHRRAEVRTFVLDRIKMLRLTEEAFTFPPDFDLEDYTRNSFQVMHGELHRVKIKVSAAWAKYISEKIWHESQRVRHLPSGALEITFHVAGLDEIKRWVMGLGAEAYVLEPDILKTQIRRDLHDTLAKYESAGSSRLNRKTRKARVGFASIRRHR